MKGEVENYFKYSISMRPYLLEIVKEANYLENRRYFKKKRDFLEGREENHYSLPKQKELVREEPKKDFFDKISTSCNFFEERQPRESILKREQFYEETEEDDYG